MLEKIYRVLRLRTTAINMWIVLGSLASVVLIGLVTVLVLAYWSVKPPHGCSDRFKLRCTLAVFKIFTVLGTITTLIIGPDFTLKMNRFLLGLGSSSRPPPSPHIETVDTSFNEVAVRIYTPKTAKRGGPGVIFYHGGGWVFGSVASYDSLMRALTTEAGIVVVSVDYRLAPEHPYPAPMEDCVQATKFFINHANDFLVNSQRIVIMGDSAGGNLAAAVAISLRNQNFRPQPKLQVLLYPPLQAIDFCLPAYELYRDHPVVPKIGFIGAVQRYAFGNLDLQLRSIFSRNGHVSPAARHKFMKHNLNLDLLHKDLIPRNYHPTHDDEGSEEVWGKIQKLFTDPLFSPLMLDDMAGLPEALVITVEHDTLRDDGIFYAERLRQAGVKTEHKYYPHTTHGIVSLTELTDAKEMRADVIQFITERL